MRKVCYRREVLVSTERFENQRVAIELETEVQAGQTFEQVYNDVKRFVDQKVLDEVITIKMGKDVVKISAEKTRNAQRRKAIADAAGLAYLLDSEIESGLNF